jgi:hypothetical protein
MQPLNRNTEIAPGSSDEKLRSRNGDEPPGEAGQRADMRALRKDWPQSGLEAAGADEG